MQQPTVAPYVFAVLCDEDDVWAGTAVNMFDENCGASRILKTRAPSERIANISHAHKATFEALDCHECTQGADKGTCLHVGTGLCRWLLAFGYMIADFGGRHVRRCVCMYVAQTVQRDLRVHALVSQQRPPYNQTTYSTSMITVAINSTHKLYLLLRCVRSELSGAGRKHVCVHFPETQKNSHLALRR